MENIESKIESDALTLANAHIKQHPPYYGQIPAELAHDSNILSQVKGLFGTMHCYSPEKHLSNNIVVEIAEETLSRDMGVTIRTIQNWIDILAMRDWIAVIRQGNMLPNKYRLFPVSGRTFEAIKGMKRVHLRLNREHGLSKRLRNSLKSDTK
jgi:hypothetical protein